MRWLECVIMLILASASASPAPKTGSLRGDEEIFMTTAEIIANRGYPVERHFITTPDGYVLEAQRIPYGRQSGPAPDKPAVFLQHGLLSSSADWIIDTTDTALGYLLADAGYDVWLGAVRGNTYGRNHSSFDPDNDSHFWDFSFDEIGAIDVPANLRYVLEKTGQTTLTYVGHSQGTLTFFIAMETNPDLNDKVNQMFALAPVSTVAHMKSPLRFVAPYADSIETITSLLGYDEFLPSSAFFDMIGQEECRANGSHISLEVCENVLFLICGPDSEEMNSDLIPLIVSHSPAGSSVQNLIHYFQEYNNANYAHYDHGYMGNLNHYGQSTPPLYDPTKVLAPVISFWGDNDWLADPVDVAWLESQLPNLKQSVHIPIFNHLDFLWAIHVKEYVNDVILANMPIKP